MTGQRRRPLAAVVLAAGEGTRMRSGTPKVLHPLCGRPMLLHVLDALAALPLERIVVVVGHGAERRHQDAAGAARHRRPGRVRRAARQRGTGDAVSVALTVFADDLDGEDDVIVVPGDAPLLRPETLAMLATEHRVGDAAATLLTARARRPHRLRPHRARRRAATSSASSSRPTPPPRSSRSTRSTRRSTASAGACSRRRCAG